MTIWKDHFHMRSGNGHHLATPPSARGVGYRFTCNAWFKYCPPTPQPCRHSDHTSLRLRFDLHRERTPPPNTAVSREPPVLQSSGTQLLISTWSSAQITGKSLMQCRARRLRATPCSAALQCCREAVTKWVVQHPWKTTHLLLYSGPKDALLVKTLKKKRDSWKVEIANIQPLLYRSPVWY